MSDKRFQQIKNHFEKEAALFDKLFFKVMPHYEEMMQSLIDSLPFLKNQKVEIIDLGCGTGNLAKKLTAAYPRAGIFCLDMAENMLAMARAKLGENRNIVFRQGDIRKFDYSAKYDAIVASMVLHHIEGKEKPGFYKKLYKSLKSGGVFCVIDIFLSPSAHLQKNFIDGWKRYMQNNGLPVKRTSDMLKRHHREDRPVCLQDEIRYLHQAGFKKVDIILKSYNFALYCAIKGR